MRKIFSIILCLMVVMGICPYSYGQKVEEEMYFHEASLEDMYPDIVGEANKRAAKPIEFYINNKLVPFPKNGPQILKEIPEDGYFRDAFMAELLIPISYIRDGFGYKVDWNPVTKQINFNNGEIKAYIDQKSVEYANRIMATDAPVLRGDRSYVTLEFIEHALGWAHTYDASGPTQKYIFTKLDKFPALTDAILAESNKNENYRPQDVPIYASSPTQYGYNDTTKHWVEWDRMGSNTLNTTVRSKGTPIPKDLEYLNSLVGRFGYGFAGDGQLTIGGEGTHIDTPRGSSDTYVAIAYGSESRAVTVRGWIPKTNRKPSQSQIVQHNLIIESIKYFSNSIEDGHAIIAYVDKHVNKKQYPPFDQNMTFGSTTVRFEKRILGWGFDIIYKR